MLSRALSLATGALLIGCFAAGAARAQVTNLEAGKSPFQIFAGTCNACHKSPRGLLKSVPASSLPGFLRQHYTTSSDMASVLAAYLVSNGATDTRYQAKQDQAKQGRDARQEAVRPAGQPDQLDRFGRRQRPAAPAPEAAGEADRAATPGASRLTPQDEGGRVGRSAKRLARPSDTPEATAPGQAAADSKSAARRKLSKRGKGSEELPKPDAAKPDSAKEETAKGEAPKDDASPGKTEADKTAAKTDAAKAGETEPTKTDTAKDEADKPAEGAKPVSEGRSESAKFDTPRQTGSGEPTPLQPDPVPPVTPAASATTAGRPEPSTSPSAAARPVATPELPPATASAPPPLAPTGPPIPPISQ